MMVKHVDIDLIAEAQEIFLGRTQFNLLDQAAFP